LLASRPEDESASERTVTAKVIESLPNDMFRLEGEGGSKITAHVAATSGRDFLRLLPGDRVGVALSPRDRGRGRILERY
jgi:translation initiation factor IF-1